MTDLPQNWVEVPFTKPFDIQGGTQPPKSSFIYEEKEGYIITPNQRFWEKACANLYTYKENFENLCR